MIGAIAGDIIGSVYEWNNIKTKEFPLFSDKCFFTDDSVLTIALADSILTGEPYIRNLKKFFSLYPDRGFGNGFAAWAKSGSIEPYNSWGNGSAMRISPVGYAFQSIDEVLNNAYEFTKITHNHAEGIKGAVATAAAIYLAWTTRTKNDIKRPVYLGDVSCQGTVPQAIRAFLDSTGFEDAIRTAVSLGGDSDTLACITGGIAQAFYGGVPTEIQNKVYEVLDDRLKEISEKFMLKYCNKY